MHPITALECEYSIWTRDIEDIIFPVLRQLDIGIVAYRPLGAGFFTDVAVAVDSLAPGDFRGSNPRFEPGNLEHNRRLLAGLAAIAQQKGTTVAQLALAWLLAQADDVVPIPGMDCRKYLEENIVATQVTLTPEDLRKVEEAFPKGVVAGERLADYSRIDRRRGTTVSKPGSTSPDEGAIIRVVNLEKRFRRERGSTFAAIDGVSVEIKSRLDGHDPRAERLREDNAVPMHCRVGTTHWGRNLERVKSSVIREERRDRASRAPGLWHDVPKLRRMASHVGLRQCLYPLKLRRWSKAQIEARGPGCSGSSACHTSATSSPARLSGGQQQRVALARALVCDPKVILFDEPLSNVDAKVREELRVELLAMQKRIGFAGVYVTHDQEEAMVISDRVVVMREGRVLQEGSPRSTVSRASRFVASFIGVANLWPARLSSTEGRADQVVAVADLGKLVIAAENVPAEVGSGGQVVVVARPEAVVVSKQQVPQAANSWSGVVRVAMFKGAHVELLVEVTGQLVRGRSREELAPSEGDQVYISVSPQGLRVLPAGLDEPERREDHNDEEVVLAASEGVLMDGGPPKPGGVPAPIT